MSVQSQKPNPMFQTYSSLEEALENANTLVKALPRAHHLPAFTAVYGMLNTALKLQEEKPASVSGATLVVPSRQLPSDPNFQKNFVVGDLTPNEALQILRNEFAGFIIAAMRVRSLDPELGAEVVTILMLIAQAFTLHIDEIDKEVQELRLLNMLSKFLQKP